MSQELKNLELIQGDLLEAKVDLIVHQCNCVTNRAVGIAEKINKKYPYADIYSNRTTADTPGTCKIMKSADGPYVACLLAQYKPGKPYGTDSKANRLLWFQSALQQMLELIQDLKITTIGFPGGIACGYAGGKWEDYYPIIVKFAETNKYQVKIYQI